MDAKVFVPPPRLSVDSFDGPLGRSIIDTHIWAVDQGLRGAGAYALFDGYCQRLVIHGVPLWRATSPPSSRSNMPAAIWAIRNGCAARCTI
jgi:hypothetical protein